MMEKLSLVFLIHTLHFFVEVSIELIPLELSLIDRCHHDVIREGGTLLEEIIILPLTIASSLTCHRSPP
jgi:hypothetical protein